MSRDGEGKFTISRGSLKCKRTSRRYDRVTTRTRRPLINYPDKNSLEHTIMTYQFNNEEIGKRQAIRFSASYGFIVRIDDTENLCYSVLKYWKLK